MFFCKNVRYDVEVTGTKTEWESLLTCAHDSPSRANLYGVYIDVQRVAVVGTDGYRLLRIEAPTNAKDDFQPNDEEVNCFVPRGPLEKALEGLKAKQKVTVVVQGPNQYYFKLEGEILAFLKDLIDDTRNTLIDDLDLRGEYCSVHFPAYVPFLESAGEGISSEVAIGLNPYQLGDMCAVFRKLVGRSRTDKNQPCMKIESLNGEHHPAIFSATTSDASTVTGFIMAMRC